MARNTSGRESDSKLIALVKNALGLKANTADLARVATTGSYNDLSGKPTIPSVPQMATAADMSDWTSGKTVDAAVLKVDFQQALALLETKANAEDVPTAVSDLANDSGFQTAVQVQTYVQQQIAAIPDELPTVTASDNGKFLRVVSGTWAAETVQTWQGGSY